MNDAVSGIERAASALDEIALQVRECARCALSQTRTHTVPGEGSATAEVMFIGEGPGQEEDKQGRPFVGRAGKLLDELIESVGMRRSDVYILNMVKCRPPGNRNPESGEIAACSDYLDAQIEVVDPVLLVTLGAVPLSRFAPGSRVSQVRGTLMEFQGRALLPTYHPAYALRNASAVPTMRADFQRIPEGLLAGIRMRVSAPVRESVAANVVEESEVKVRITDAVVADEVEDVATEDGQVDDAGPGVSGALDSENEGAAESVAAGSDREGEIAAQVGAVVSASDSDAVIESVSTDDAEDVGVRPETVVQESAESGDESFEAVVDESDESIGVESESVVESAAKDVVERSDSVADEPERTDDSGPESVSDASDRESVGQTQDDGEMGPPVGRFDDPRNQGALM